MMDTESPPARSLAIWKDRGLMARIGKYTTGSVVAAISSEVTFIVVYGAGVRSTISTFVAFLAGAIPNYFLNRRWAWQRSGRAHRREVALYLAVILSSLLVTMAFTWVGARIANHYFEYRGAQTVFVERGLPLRQRCDIRHEVRALQPVRVHRPRRSRHHVPAITLK